ncbi:MAG: helix-turn-helix transcriptional regulator [Anaerolineaceae bacterium]|nr:helix-turn-helix transcriptional regulator [Anaerolineaceae bacterium]
MKYTEYKQRLESDPEYIEAYKAVALHLGLANAVFKARMERGLTQTALAKSIGTKQANISKIESGLGNPTINLIQKLVNFLEIEITFATVKANQSSQTQKNMRSFSHKNVFEILPDSSPKISQSAFYPIESDNSSKKNSKTLSQPPDDEVLSLLFSLNSQQKKDDAIKK